MSEPQAVLPLLDAALEASRRMLQMAQNGEWDALVDCELERRQLIAQLRLLEQTGPLIPEASADRDAIVRQMTDILETDRQTGELVRAWMDHISKDLGELDLARKVSAAYGVR